MSTAAKVLGFATEAVKLLGGLIRPAPARTRRDYWADFRRKVAAKPHRKDAPKP